MSSWRFKATMDRLISNIPAACKILEEQGYRNLAGQLRRDQENLALWFGEEADDTSDLSGGEGL